MYPQFPHSKISFQTTFGGVILKGILQETQDTTFLVTLNVVRLFAFLGDLASLILSPSKKR
jgi:hypothetical protein